MRAVAALGELEEDPEITYALGTLVAVVVDVFVPAGTAAVVVEADVTVIVAVVVKAVVAVDEAYWIEVVVVARPEIPDVVAPDRDVEERT